MRKYLAIGLGVLLSLSAIAQANGIDRSGSDRPNIVWIVCEDMSLRLSCYGEKAIQTPHLDALAAEGIRYTNAYTVAGVCAPSRNSIITAMYPMSIGGDNMRNFQPAQQDKEESVAGVPPSYSIVPPDYVRCFPLYLREAGYYCTNNAKEDYQFAVPPTVWDDSGNKAHWKNRPDGKPFFAIFNLGVTHESQIWKRDDQPLLADPAKVDVPPYYPDVPEVRHDIARHLSNVVEMDRQAGKLINELKAAGLYDNTIIFFYSDHGDGLPYVKREITRRGLHIPLVVKMPSGVQAGQVDDQLISAIDFGPTVMSLAGIETPAYMHGRAFLGKYRAPLPRSYIFAARDRMDGEVDRVRSVYDGRYQYLRNYMPGQTYYQPIVYRLQMPMMQKIMAMKAESALNPTVMRWFEVKPAEELYDLQTDPYQLHNLAGDKAYAAQQQRLAAAYDVWYHETGDLHRLDEESLLSHMRGGQPDEPATAAVQVVPAGRGVYLYCPTLGATIGYRPTNTSQRSAAWIPYTNQRLDLPDGTEIDVVAQRIGFSPVQQHLIINHSVK